jgi:hypothetical protein
MKMRRLGQIALASLVGLLVFPNVSWSQTVINSIQDLQNINNNLAGSYVLGGDIDAIGTAGWNGGKGFIPIGNINNPFTGSFDGQGHTINGLTSSYSPIFYSGLFGLVGQSGIVKNVELTNANIMTGFISGEGGGVLVGFNIGTVINSYATGAINGGNFASNVGGLVGTNGALVTQSYADVAVSGNGIFSYGGLVGDNAGTISQSYATGPVSATAQNLGGLVGLNLGTVTTSYWDTQTTKQSTSAGGIGLTTAQFQSGTLPTGFDPTVWVAAQGQYPQLQWQVPTKPAFPVVFVHGICSDRHTCDTLKNTLINFGWHYGGNVGNIGNFRITDLDPNYASNADFYTVTFSDPEILSGLQSWGLELQYFLHTIKKYRGKPNDTKCPNLNRIGCISHL